MQKYDMGEYISTREYDPSADWAEIESLGMGSARSADKAGDGMYVC